MTPSPSNRLRRIARFLGPRTVRLLAIGVAAGIGIFAAEVSFAYALQLFLTTIGVMPATSLRLPIRIPPLGLATVLEIVCFLGVFRSILYWTQFALQGIAEEEARNRQRRLLLSWALNSESSSLSDVTTLFNARTNSMGTVVSSLQTLAVQLSAGLFIGINLLIMSPRVTISLAISLMILVPPLRWADRVTKTAGERLNSAWDRLSRNLIVGIKNLLLLQVYGTQDLEIARADGHLAVYKKEYGRFQLISGFKYGLPQVAGLILVCIVAMASRRAELTSGALITYFYLFLRLMQTFAVANQSVSSIIVYWPQARELMMWWEKHAHTVPALRAAHPDIKPFDAPVGWRLNGVEFSYPEARTPALSSTTIEVRPGTAAVITGPSGSGKSTLLSILLGALAPTKGAIQILDESGNPRPLAERRAALLRSVGYVGPESFILEGSVRENLVYGLERTPSDDELFRALDRAQCQFIREMPRGLDHRLTEQGQGLSAGQKQRLALARALLKNPRVLVLDEATANLDAATEARLLETLRKLKGAMTIIAATHRPALLALADKRVELESSAAASDV
ncbi:MAG: ABC transporter ATP-binding protein [Elusimicrobia bacterium]|nr:ABC transporter ATP-binding protein [Elusimicrobiota bacterium]